MRKRLQTWEEARKEFWAGVSIRGPDDCWPWKACTDKRTGHGRKVIRGRLRGAHVWAYMFGKGIVGDGQAVRHKCDNPPCCNPRHLLLGSQVQNIEDMHERGRYRSSIGVSKNRGETNPNAKLNEGLVSRIRWLHGKGCKTAKIARALGLSYGMVYDVISGRRWAHVK